MNTKSAVTPQRSQIVKVSVDKEHFRRIQIEDGVTICHLYPTLAAWVGKEVREDVNPRSHDEDAIKGSVAKAIEQTIRDYPGDFYLANRGETILANSITYNPEKQEVEIGFTEDSGDSAVHGVADGATTDAVIARVQSEIAHPSAVNFRSLTPDQIPDFLRNARVHLEVVVGLTERERIARLVQGRNTSRQVKTWTIADFEGKFEWIKEVLEEEGSPFKGRIGYEENAGKDANILDVIAIMTLFHPAYNSKGTAPTVAYSSKGRMDKTLVDESRKEGYQLLKAVLRDILKLHDHVYAGFGQKYTETFPKGKLGRRGETGKRVFVKADDHRLPLTHRKATYIIPSGVLYPLLASLRALLRFPGEGEKGGATWIVDPCKFFDQNGAELMDNLISQLEVLQNNPQTMGKTKTVYTALHDRARLLVKDAENGVN